MWSELWNSVWCSVFVFLRPMFKWILRRVTGKCELLRITYEEDNGAARTKKIEKSLRQSRLPVVKRLIAEENPSIEDAVKEVMVVKGIVPEVHQSFAAHFRACVCQICGYQSLLSQVEERRKVKYNTADKQHEDRLMQLWKLMMPSEELKSRVNKQWTHIGFQGDDPATDFRGMGMLGLDQLLYFVEEYPEVCLNLLSQSHHPQLGFSYAILGINFTGMAYELLKGRKLRTHFYNLSSEAATIKQFHDVYCYLFYEFIQFWFKEKPRDIMEFGRLRDKFQKRVTKQLKEANTVLIAEFQKSSQQEQKS